MKRLIDTMTRCGAMSPSPLIPPWWLSIPTVPKDSHHVIVDEDIFWARLHLVVIDVPDDDSQRTGGWHGRVAAVLDHDRDGVLLLLLTIKGPLRVNDCHTVTVGSLWIVKKKTKNIFRGPFTDIRQNDGDSANLSAKRKKNYLP